MEQIKQKFPSLLILDVKKEDILQAESLMQEIEEFPVNFPIILIQEQYGKIKYKKLLEYSQIYCFCAHPLNKDRFNNIVKRAVNSFKTAKKRNEDIITDKQHIKREESPGFELVKCIGEGSFGSVYQGIYQNQNVAIKFLIKNKLSDEVIKRFKREVQILRNLVHPNIIKLLLTGTNIDGSYYMILEYFEGNNLDVIIEERGRIPINEAVNIILQIARGMTVAHKFHMIHRDLKPSNILYNEETKMVKIVDFGLVKQSNIEQHITRTGCLLGSPYYMSPEQCQGNFLDGRTDIYSLGITFYQLLTGVVPFDRDTPLKTLLAHLYDKIVWPTNLIFIIPFTIRRIVEKMTAKFLPDRYQNMQEVITTLEDYLKGNN